MFSYRVSWKETNKKSVLIQASSEEEARQKVLDDDYEESDVETDEAVFHGITDVSSEPL